MYYCINSLHLNKMNKLFTLFLIFLCIDVKGQDTNLAKAYSEVMVLTDPASKDELFSRAKSSFAHLFRNSQKVIQNEDKDAGIIIGKGNIKAYARTLGKDYDAGYVNFTLTIACKDGRYRYTITDLVHQGTGSNMPSGGSLENTSAHSWTDKQWNLMKSQINDNIKGLISSIKLDMNKPSPKNDDW